MKRSASSVVRCGMRNRWEHFEQVICVPAKLRSKAQGALQNGHFVSIVFVGWGSTGITSSTSSVWLGAGSAGAEGTIIRAPHFGHFVFLPAKSSLTENALPQPGQLKSIME